MIDEVRIKAIAGHGGNGCVSFRREKFVPLGGPNGGDGGRGGNVVIVADGSANTLREVGRRRLYRAGSGKSGKGDGMHGGRGVDVQVGVPVGTQVWREHETGGKELLGDLTEAGQELVVAKGGLGGCGNARFATATYQAPRIAERGQKGEEGELLLELKLLADVGITGLPNVGKSSLLACVSRAQPKVADYPFTTLVPNLGVVDNVYRPFVMADMPGLIEGAHRRVGLGLDFLRHMERTHVTVHLLDGSRPGLLEDMAAINNELALYRDELRAKEQLIVVNKIDLPEVRARIPALRRDLEARGLKPVFVSAATGEGMSELIQLLAASIDRRREAAVVVVPAGEVKAPRLRPGRRFSVIHEGEGFRVEGEQVITFASMMPLDSVEGRAVFWQRVAAMGVIAALRRAGAQFGDKIRFGDIELEWPG